MYTYSNRVLIQPATARGNGIAQLVSNRT